MLLQLFSLTIFAALVAAVYSLFLTTFTWALELRHNLLNANVKAQNVPTICRTCGTNFTENCSVEDGKCKICGTILCSRCGLEWICPLCYKKRERARGVHLQHAALTKSKILKVLKMNGYGAGRAGHYEELYGISNNFSNLRSTCSEDFRYEKTLFPEYGVNFSNDTFQKNESNEDPRLLTTWQQNWLFKKKTTNDNFKPLAMFLPSPKHCSKALVGGINIDELSDLSDCSDSEINDILN